MFRGTPTTIAISITRACTGTAQSMCIAHDGWRGMAMLSAT
jgi:hypothetical protein